jgi:hypothetical protein
MQTCHNSSINADSRITEALDAEASIMAQIEQEENAQKLRDLPHPSQTVSYYLPYKDYTNIIKDHYER